MSDLRAAVEAHTRALLAFDCIEDEVPDGVDVPDDYERGLHDAATGYMQILQDATTPPTPPPAAAVRAESETEGDAHVQ